MEGLKLDEPAMPLRSSVSRSPCTPSFRPASRSVWSDTGDTGDTGDSLRETLKMDETVNKLFIRDDLADLNLAVS